VSLPQTVAARCVVDCRNELVRCDDHLHAPGNVCLHLLKRHRNVDDIILLTSKDDHEVLR